MVKKALALEAFKVGSKVWVLTIGVLEVNPEVESIRAQRGRARSALFHRVLVKSRGSPFRCDYLESPPKKSPEAITLLAGCKIQ